MLLTELILSKSGPLAKVWLSAHHERKLSKQQALGVDVEKSVDAILEQEEGPITLRLSGQLMLGVTRIYSRKVQYLLDDCKETRERISTAFRPGIVDLPEDQVRASKNAITFSDASNDFNYFDWSWAAPPADLVTRASGNDAALNLRPTGNREFGAYNFGRPRVASVYGGSTSSRHPSQDVETFSHLDSQDFSGVNLDLGLDNPPADGDVSIEIGRDRLASRDRSRSAGFEFGRRAGSAGLNSLKSGEGRDGLEMDFEPVDLGLDFGDAGDVTIDQPDFGGDLPLPNLEEERNRRESSALSTPPPVSPPAGVVADITPRQAVPKVKRPKILHADDELELPDDQFLAPRGNSSILTEERYIPSDPAHARFLAIEADPNAYFLRIQTVNGKTTFYAGPEGLAPELVNLFTFPVDILRKNRERSVVEDERAAKRPRVQSEEDVEIARRGSVLPPSEGGFGLDQFVNPDDTLDFPAFQDDMPFQPDEMEIVTPRAKRVRQEREPSIAPSRAESIARHVQYDVEVDPDHPLAIFDSRIQAEKESLLETPQKSSLGGTELSRTTGGYSKNTGMAMGLLRREIEAIEEEDKVVQFERIADKASRKAASSFFFELLVLGTRDFVKLDQAQAFGGIEIRGKDKLFEDMTA